MISIPHAYLPSALAYATKLPPSPTQSPSSQCDSPSENVDSRPQPSIKLEPPTTMRVVKEYHKLDTRIPLPGNSQPDLPYTRLKPSQVKQEPSLSAIPPSHDSLGGYLRSPEPRVSLEEFASEFWLQRHQESQRRNLQKRVHATRISICLSARLVRTGTTVQKGLIESFKHGDKSGFVSIYNSIHDVREGCESSWRRVIRGHDPLVSSPTGTLDSDRGHSANFAQQLTAKSQKDLLEILHLARTDSQFLFERIGSLMPAQLSALLSSIHSPEANDPVSTLASRGKSQYLFSKRNVATQSATFKEHAVALERTSSMSALIFNIFAAPTDQDSAEARLRLDVWSSTCAKLISQGGNGHHTLLGHLLSSWSTIGQWKAKMKFELYLMDILQKGAFLLEPMTNLGLDMETLDHLRSDLAEEFFESAVRDLFEVLDDSDGGLPSGSLQFGNAVFGKLNLPETRNRFLEYTFFQWFFLKFLHNAIAFPESHGLLLDYHITKEAREKLLSQVALRAEAQVSRVLHSLPQFSTAHPKVRMHVENMLSHLGNKSTPYQSNGRVSSGHRDVEANIILSATDIVTIMDALFPKTKPLFNTCEPSLSPTIPSSPSFGHSRVQQNPPTRKFEPGLFQGRIDTSCRSPTTKTAFTTEMSFQGATGSYSIPGGQTGNLLSPRSSLSRNADRIRFELSDICESTGRSATENPCNEDWALFSISQDGGSLSLKQPFEDVAPSPGASIEKSDPDSDHQALQDAVVKLVENFDLSQDSHRLHSLSDLRLPQPSLSQRFSDAMTSCQRQSDFVGAHYWWNASRLLRTLYPASIPDRDSKVLHPMFFDSNRSVNLSSSIITQCESSLVTLKRDMGRLQDMVNEMMTGLSKLRNKMWYMTDVKHSLRYEDARNVALALKNMGGQGSPEPTQQKRRSASQSLGGSFFQKPEIQVMNVMKAPGNHGGPGKLADEQVEITRTWLTRSGIDNFCRGEERIHRFCYEVKTSVNKLAGETMLDTPVLWSSELFQKERAMYESPTTRSIPGSAGVPSVRPSSIASDDVSYPFQSLGPTPRSFDHHLRSPSDFNSIGRNTSLQNLPTDKWRLSRDLSVCDVSTIGDSPGRAVSTTTVESGTSFWSPPQTQAHSTTSASSIYSRPPSLFSDTMPPPRPVDRSNHAKTSFLSDLRQTLTSLLLSDLGCPVWSLGSETDAWLSESLNQKRIRVQLEKRARAEQFLAECDSRSKRFDESDRKTRHPKRKRSRSAGPTLVRPRACSEPAAEPGQTRPLNSHESCDGEFAYDNAFRQLLEIFSRHANPLVKLNALRDLRTLVVASLSSADSDQEEPEPQIYEDGRPHPSHAGNERDTRNSISEGTGQQAEMTDLPSKPSSPTTPTFGINSRFPTLSPSETKIINVLRKLLGTLQPKTLFRDLQFIAAFVPSDILNKTETGTAFLHVGLAALSLKEDVCNSMVDIADKIVSQELSRRHPPNLYDFSQRPGYALEDAARLWAITAMEGNPVAQRELAILYLTHPELPPRTTFPLTMPRDTFKAEMMYRRDGDSKSDPQSMCLALHWMQLSANGGDELARNRLREREEFESIAS
ncbi:hypothetical protein FQN54_005316 [Arachnomyces sp. PD_36]|nr:hypothetical protein FQN54_005316 [Arachnomyces sp. PD_36]